MPTGRPKLVESPEQLWKWFAEYNKAIKANPILVKDWVGKDAEMVKREKERPLTMEGFENYVFDVGGPVSLEHYFANTDKKYEDFCTICHAIKREIRADQIEGGMANLYNPSITQRLNGLADKQEIRHDVYDVKLNL
jgi:hypothetical protein